MVANLWGWVRGARLKILGAVFSLGLALSAVTPVWAASIYQVIFSLTNFNFFTTVNLYRGKQGSFVNQGFGYEHIYSVHWLNGSTACLEDEAAYSPQASASGDYYYLGMDFSPVSNPSQIVTVMMIINYSRDTGQYSILTAYPMRRGVSRLGITSHTNIYLTGYWAHKDDGAPTYETVFPSWLNNPDEFQKG